MRTEGRVPRIGFLEALSAVKDDLLDLLETGNFLRILL